MRPLSPFLKTLVILQWTSAGSTTTSGDQTDVAAGTLSAGTALPETSASVESAGSQPQGLASGKTYDELEEQEERFSWSSLPDARKILGMDELFADVPLQLIESIKEINEKAGMIVTHDRLALWLHQFQSHGLSFHDDAPMRSLMQSKQGEKLTVLFHGIRGITGMKEFAEAMQRKLLEEYPEAMPQVSKAWRALGLRPDEAYVMMPILVEQIAAGADREKSEWPKVLQMISHWLNYVDIYRSEGFKFSNDRVIAVLRSNQSKQEVAKMLNDLRVVDSVQDRADRLLVRLQFDSWLDETKASPVQLYYQISIPVIERNVVGGGDDIDWSVILSKLDDWLDYIDKYRIRVGEFSDDEVIDILARDRHIAEVRKMFSKLLEVSGMKVRAGRMLRSLETRNKMRFDRWLQSYTSPEIAYNLMHISNALDFWDAGKKESSWPFVLSELEAWLDYVDKYRYLGENFSNVRVMKVLAKKRRREELGEILYKLQNDSVMKERAARLVVRFHLIEWLEQGLSPAEVYSKMPVSATKYFLGGGGEDADWPTILSNLEDWIDYILMYRVKVGQFSFSQAVEVLMADIRFEEAVEMFHKFRKVDHTRDPADQMQRQLLYRSPASPYYTLKPMIEMWLGSKVSPAHVFTMLPFPARTTADGAANDTLHKRIVHIILSYWILYVEKYREVGTFSNDEVLASLLKIFK